MVTFQRVPIYNAYPPSNKNCKGVVRTDRARGKQDQENG